MIWLHGYIYLNKVAHNYKPADNYYRTLQLCSALCSCLASFSLWFRFYGPQLYCFGSLSALSTGAVFCEQAIKSHCTLPTQHDTARRQSKTNTAIHDQLRSRIFPSGVCQDQSEFQGGTILDTIEWMIQMLLCLPKV